MNTPITRYQPRHPKFPYTEADFARQDPRPDGSFYSSPRFVTHIDDAAIESLSRYYDTALPRKGRILDFCSSWISHYPARIENASKEGSVIVVGMGMNNAELSRNPILTRTILQDLNEDPTIPTIVCGENGEDELLDASTCVVSIDYLINPVEVLSSLRQRTRIGGTVHLAVSNRCFPTKAIARWLQSSEEQRLLLVGDYLWFSGWRDIEIVDVKACNDRQQGKTDPAEPSQSSGFQSLMAMMGMGHGDPLWVVRAKRTE